MLINRQDLTDNSYEVFKKNAAVLRRNVNNTDESNASLDDIQALIKSKQTKGNI